MFCLIIVFPSFVWGHIYLVDIQFQNHKKLIPSFNSCSLVYFFSQRQHWFLVYILIKHSNKALISWNRLIHRGPQSLQEAHCYLAMERYMELNKNLSVFLFLSYKDLFHSLFWKSTKLEVKLKWNKNVQYFTFPLPSLLLLPFASITIISIFQDPDQIHQL